VGYFQGLVREPRNAIMVLISDLYEGGVEKNLLQRASELIESGVQFITLLPLSDEGSPAYDHDLAPKLALLGSPAFACTPEQFPERIAAAIRREDIAGWAARNEITTSRGARQSSPFVSSQTKPVADKSGSGNGNVVAARPP
jgi:hypothetical protein